MNSKRDGKIFLVGCGPGHPELLTLRAASVLSRCDCVFYDYLANPAALRHAAPGARIVCLGQHGESRIWTQAEVNAALVEEAGQGKWVARLKGGDPMIFGRAASELAAASAAGIEVEIVPGISAAIGAASFSGIPLTHREHASAVAFVTGQEMAGRDESQLDYAALARFPGTLVIYMGVTTVADWSARLISAGKSPATPVAVIRRVSHPSQRRLTTTLGQVSEQLHQHKLRPPAVVIVGDVAAETHTHDWFTKRPLFGSRIWVTRPRVSWPIQTHDSSGIPATAAREQGSDLAGQLIELGADVIRQPLIEIGRLADCSGLAAICRRLAEFEWIVFASGNGVHALLTQLWETGGDSRQLAGVKLAAVGPATVAALAEFQLRADLCPTKHKAEELAEAIIAKQPTGKVLLVRGSRGRDTLAEMLTQAGLAVEQISAYENRDVTALDAEFLANLQENPPDWITVTSSALARNLARLGQDHFPDLLADVQLASLSPVTSQTLRECGLRPAVEATDFTMAGLVAVILAAN